MKIFNMSIKYKLILLITSITLVSSLIVLQVINIYVQKKNQNNLQNESQVLAKLIGEFVVPAIAFHDKPGAYEIISRTKLLDKVNSIVIVDTSGIIFSEHHRNPSVKSNLNEKIKVTGIDTSFIVEDCLTVESRIVYSGIFYGYIIMKSEYDEFNIFKNELNLSLFLIISIVLVISLILSTSFQKIISKPIVELTSIALNVLETNNFDVKLNEEQTDEFGLLNRTFNAMFGKISKQNIEREEAAKIISENEMRYRVLFNYSPIPIFLFDNEICTMSNYASYNLLRTSNENDIIGKNYKEIFITDNPDNYKHIFSHNMFNQRRLSSNFRIIDINNNSINVELSSMLIRNENVFTNIIMCMDISDKIEYEKKLLKLNEELEIRVSQRTAILEETLTKINEQNALLNSKEKELSDAKDEAENTAKEYAGLTDNSKFQ